MAGSISILAQWHAITSEHDNPGKIVSTVQLNTNLNIKPKATLKKIVGDRPRPAP
jgi:hypothetical protein